MIVTVQSSVARRRNSRLLSLAQEIGRLSTADVLRNEDEEQLKKKRSKTKQKEKQEKVFPLRRR